MNRFYGFRGGDRFCGMGGERGGEKREERKFDDDFYPGYKKESKIMSLRRPQKQRKDTQKIENLTTKWIPSPNMQKPEKNSARGHKT